MEHDKIICIYCGNKALIVNEKKSKFVHCNFCKTKINLEKYNKRLEKWLADIKKKNISG
jgi:hypothetical protein